MAASHVLSRSSSGSRPSVMTAAAQMKASKVRLFRNGDPFFKGIMLAITVERFRTFDSLLAELNKTTLCDPSVLHKGVRYIFTLKGEQVRSLDQLQDGYAYVCASTPVFRRMDYSKITKPMNWKMNFRNGDESKTGIAKSFGDFNDIDRNYIEPRMIYTIRAGPRPRNMARMLLNKRTARSFDQVMTDLAESVNMETGTIRQLYTITGKQVLSLRDFFQDDSIFVAFGSEKFSLSELKLNDVETKFASGSSQRNARSATVRTTSQVRRGKSKSQSRSPDGCLSKILPSASSLNSQTNSMGKGTGEHWQNSSSSVAPASSSSVAPASFSSVAPASFSSVAPASSSSVAPASSSSVAPAYSSSVAPAYSSSVAPASSSLVAPASSSSVAPASSSSVAPASTSAELQQKIHSVQRPVIRRIIDQSKPPSPAPVHEEPDFSSSAKGLETLPAANQDTQAGKVSSEKNSKTVPSGTRIDKNNDQRIPLVLLTKYHVGKAVGRCGYVSLHTGVDIKNQSSVAFKVYNKTKMSKEKECLAYSELTLMKRMKHQNIIHLLDDLDTPTSLFMVLELPKGRDLLESIVSYADYSEVDASHLLFQLCFAINFLHSMNIVHRNIRPESILVSLESSGRKHLKLSDFSMAVEIVAPLSTPCGELSYMAPEMLSEKRYSTKVDVWSAGVVGYIMLCGYLPYTGSTEEELLIRIKSGPLDFPSPAWDGISDSAKDLIAFMLEEDVTIRSTATDVLDHPWLSENEQNNFNLQPTVASNILKLTGPMDKCRRIFAAIIGMGNLEGTNGQHNFEVHDDPASDDVPMYPAAALTASSPHVDSATKSPLAVPVVNS